MADLEATPSREQHAQLEIVDRALSGPALFVAALERGLGPSDGQSLGGWVAETVDQARQSVLKNSSPCCEQEPLRHRVQGTD